MKTIFSDFELIASQPWAILPQALEALAAEAIGESVQAASLGLPVQGDRAASLADGVAVIPVTGPIFRHASLFTEFLGVITLDRLTQDFANALDNPAVERVVLVFDSPGGQVNGIAEFAQLVREAGKPVTAYVDGMAASAAYWIASAADRIVASKTAMLGSIGTVITLDARKRDGQIEIVSSQSPNKRPDISTDAGRAQIQELIDRLAQVFVEDVAAYRAVSVPTVLGDFGAGGMLIAADAVARGMADGVGIFSDAIRIKQVKKGTPMTYSLQPTAPRSATGDARSAAMAEWNRNPALEREFGTFESYFAYCKANNAGLVRIFWKDSRHGV